MDDMKKNKFSITKQWRGGKLINEELGCSPEAETWEEGGMAARAKRRARKMNKFFEEIIVTGFGDERDIW